MIAIELTTLGKVCVVILGITFLAVLANFLRYRKEKDIKENTSEDEHFYFWKGEYYEEIYYLIN